MSQPRRTDLLLLLPFILTAFPASCQQLEQQPAAQEVPGKPDQVLQQQRVWLYAFIAGDEDGARIFPHWVDWYHALGISYRKFIIDVAHEPHHSQRGLRGVLKLCAQHSILCRRHEVPYSSDAQDRMLLLSLAQLLRHPEDWVIVADSDEFIDFGVRSIHQLLPQLKDAQASYLRGVVEDRVAPGGALRSVAATPSLAEQFPLACSLADAAGNRPLKVVLFKAYLRPGTGHHFMVEPEWAPQYFGGACTPGEARCEGMLRVYGAPYSQDLTMVTPYSRWRWRYATSDPNTTALAAELGVPEPRTRWQVREHTAGWARVLHYHWHRGVQRYMRRQLAHYANDCREGANEASCSPRHPAWQAMAKAYSHVQTHSMVDTSRWSCKLPGNTQPGAQLLDRSMRYLPYYPYTL